MPVGRNLSPAERSYLVKLWQEGKSFRKISGNFDNFLFVYIFTNFKR